MICFIYILSDFVGFSKTFRNPDLSGKPVALMIIDACPLMRVKEYLSVSINQSIILFLPKSAYIENKFDSSGQKRRRWQNDIR